MPEDPSQGKARQRVGRDRPIVAYPRITNVAEEGVSSIGEGIEVGDFRDKEVGKQAPDRRESEGFRVISSCDDLRIWEIRVELRRGSLPHSLCEQLEEGKKRSSRYTHATPPNSASPRRVATFGTSSGSPPHGLRVSNPYGACDEVRAM